VTRLEVRENPATLVPGFAEQTMASALAAPTAIEFSPDGKLFVLEQDGTCEVWQNGTLLQSDFFAAAPVPTNAFFEQGLLGIAFHPDYANNRFVYIYYTSTSAGTPHVIARYTANATGDLATGGPNTTLTLDPHSAGNHNGGAIHFGPDGKLYVATGDNASGGNSQSIANRHGKILRYNADLTIPTGGEANPTTFPGIAGSTTGVNQAIWAVGLRNPFTTAFDPVTGRFHINDVGSGGGGAGGFGAFEEINLGGRGLNYGWPASEGTPPPPNQNPNHTYPFYAYPRSGGPVTGTTIAGGAFYRPANVMFPTNRVGDYFFADYGAGWIKSIDLKTGIVSDLATAANGPVDLKVHPDGSLYYSSINTGVVRRIYSAPRVVSTVVNDGTSSQRSRVTAITLTFNEVVNLNANSFTLTRNGGGPVGFTPTTSVVNNHTVVTLSNFTGDETEANLGLRSLRDGRYTLTAVANQITAGAAPNVLLTLDGDGNGVGTAGDNYTFGDAQGLFRMFGDFTGDRQVDGADFGAFSSTFNLTSASPSFLAFFDVNGDNVVDGFDFSAFNGRYNTMLP
jgi:glucose/arabinose dehydrogenase